MALLFLFIFTMLASLSPSQAVRMRIAENVDDKGIIHTCCVKKETAGVLATDAEYQKRASEAFSFMKQEGAYDKVDAQRLKTHAEKGLKLTADAVKATTITESQASAFFSDFAGIQAGREGLLKAPNCESLGPDWVHEDSDDKFRCHNFLKVKKAFEALIASQKLKAELLQLTTQQLSGNSDKFANSSGQKCCVRPDGFMNLNSDPNVYLDWAYKAAVDMLLTGVYSDNAAHGGATSLKYEQHMKLGVKPRFVPSAGTYPDPGTWKIDAFYQLFHGFRTSSCKKGSEALSYSGESGGKFEEDWVEADSKAEFRCSEAFAHVFRSFRTFKAFKEAQQAQEKAADQAM